MHSEVGSDADYRRGTIKLRTLETIPWRISGAADTGVRRVRISRVVDAGAASGVDATKIFAFDGVSWKTGRARRIFDSHSNLISIVLVDYARPKRKNLTNGVPWIRVVKNLKQVRLRRAVWRGSWDRR